MDQPQPDTFANGVCTYGEDHAPGAGCIKPAGHTGAHLVTPGEGDFDDEHPVTEPQRVQHSGPDTKFCVLCVSGEHERVDEPTAGAQQPEPEERRGRWDDELRPFAEAGNLNLAQLRTAAMGVANEEQRELVARLGQYADRGIANGQEADRLRAELEQANATLARVQAVLDSGDEMIGLDDIRTALATPSEN